MSVKYSIVERKDPRNEDAPFKFYAHAQADGETDFDDLCEDVSSRCTATKADIGASIDGALVSIQKALRNGEIVRFGNFGSFQIGLRSKGAETEKMFNTGFIRGAKISFRPGKMLVNMLKTLDYAQVSQLPVKVITVPVIPIIEA